MKNSDEYADERLAALLAALPDIKMLVASDGRIRRAYAAPNSDLVFGRPSATLAGLLLPELFPLPIGQGLTANLHKARTEARGQLFAFTLSTVAGQQQYEAHINALDDDTLLFVFRDTTLSVQAEQNLREQLHELQLKNRQLQHYIDSSLQLENFAYIASHDLREPLRTLLTFAQILQRRNAQHLDEEGRRAIHFITESAQQMNRLIEDMLAYSRVDSEAQERVSLVPRDLLEAILRSLGGVVQDQQVEIVLGPLPEQIQAIETKVWQLFQNLITNAIKFRAPDRRPLIRIEGSERADHWQFSLADNGIGIPEVGRERIFMLFKTLHPRGKYQGTGMGLAICKKVVEQHGGQIWLESREGEGTTFYFTLAKK